MKEKPVEVLEWKVIKLYSPSAHRWHYINYKSISLKLAQWMPVKKWHSFPCYYCLITCLGMRQGEGTYYIDRKTNAVKSVRDDMDMSLPIKDEDYLKMYKAKKNSQLLKLFPTATLLLKRYGKSKKFPYGHAEYEIVED